MLRDSTARRSESSYSSKLHIMPKKDNGWRTCEDYGALKARTLTDTPPATFMTSLTTFSLVP
jgi:hypothetical protein